MGYSQNDPQDFYHDDPIEEISKSKSRFKFLTTSAIILGSIFYFQSTLAGNISLSSGTGIEFGQGFSQAVACSGNTDLTLTPRSIFTNASPGAHYLNSVTVSGIPDSCFGVDFTINAYGVSDNSPLALFNSTSTAAVVSDEAGTFSRGTGSKGMTVASSTGTFTVTFTTPVALASSVSKITLQSGPTGGLVYAVGQTGPGGGTVFYVANTPFACGPTLAEKCYYLEAALTSGTNAWSDVARTWSTGGNQSLSVVNATGTGIGTGYKNSLAIAAQISNVAASSAAVAARGYAGPNNLSDWFLPSKDELNQLYIRRTNVGGFVNDSYWSSTEYNASYAWGQYFGDGYQFGTNKLVTFYVRPVRAF